MNIYEAEAIGKTGQRFRRAASTSWFSIGDGDLWYIQPQGEPKRVVRSSDFTAANFFATDYTTDPITNGDVCSLPGAVRPPFNAPSVSIKASFASDVLIITGTIGEGTYGAYRLTFLVNGEAVGHALATASGTFSKVVSFSWVPRMVVTFRAESVLPLDPWKGEASKVLAPASTVCFTVPVADYVVEISAAQFVRYVTGGTWSYAASQTESEIWTGGSVVGGATGAGSGSFAGCSATVPAEYSGTLTPGGPYASSLPVSLSFGVSGGHYYMGVSMLIPSFATTEPGTASPYGSATLTVDGLAIPVRSIWGPSYASNPGYVTTTHSEVVLTFTP